MGHSTRTLAEFVTLLRQVEVSLLVDVRCWWRCHRRIISDYLLAGGTPIEHIMGRDQVVPATITPDARVMAGGTLRYSAPDDGDSPASGE